VKALLAALPRAESKRPKACLAAVEQLTASVAFDRAARIADLGRTRSGEKVNTAFPARDYRVHHGEWAISGKLWMIVPEPRFRNAVAFTAKRNEILKLVRFAVVREQTKRARVMHDRTGFAAMLARFFVPLKCRFGLAFPVRAAIAVTPTEPRRVVLAGPLTGSSPDGPAAARAQIAIRERTRHFLKYLSANVANDLDALATDADSIDFLPSRIAGKTAKWVHCESDVIGSPLELLPALSARCNMHTMIIHSVDYCIKRTLRYG